MSADVSMYSKMKPTLRCSRLSVSYTHLYVDNTRCAGVACADSRTFVMGFTFEALESDVQRDRLMADILGFLLGGKSGGDD